jgi:hypothetical protein
MTELQDVLARNYPAKQESEIREFASGAVLARGLAILYPEPGGATEQPQGLHTLAAVVDVSEDPELQGLFEWRDRVTTEEFAEEFSCVGRWRSLIHPTRPVAHVILEVDFEAPVPMRRRFLFDVRQVGDNLAGVGRMMVGLARPELLERHTHSRAPGEFARTLERMLLVAGPGPSEGVRRALERVGGIPPR